MNPVAAFAMLSVGPHHGSDVPSDTASRTWHALVEARNGAWSLQPVKVTVETVRDEMVDPKEGPFTGREVRATKVEGQIRILISGDLTPGPLQVANPKPTRLWPGQHQRLTVGQHWIALSAFGTVPKPSGSSGAFLHSFGLLATTEGDRRNPVTLFENAVDDAHPSAWFVGDLDRDGFPDVIAQTSPKYSFSQTTLLLSSPSNGKSLTTVAVYAEYGC
ncbi:MAG: hypothetical protein AAGA48_08860 [Myxococcota bacterium]